MAGPLLYLLSMTPFLLSRRRTRIVAALTLSLALTSLTVAQTKIVAPKNKYSVAEDVKLGREAAAQVKKELPMLNDDRVDDWVEDIGSSLARAVPPEFRHPEFSYTFDVVNQKDINAFALPGGPMFLNRGMIEAAKTEGEVAGVMAHEMSHVALRHGTAQASSGQGAQIGGILGQIAGAIIGGTAGSILSTGSQVVAGAYITKYSRAYESQADILGAQMLARAGYDPREMANMFKTLAEEGGSRGPEWLSSHPDPGNRYNAIVKEAASLRVEGNANTGQFQSVQGASERNVAGVHGRADREGPDEIVADDGGNSGAGECPAAVHAVPIVAASELHALEPAVELERGQRRGRRRHLRAGGRLHRVSGRIRVHPWIPDRRDRSRQRQPAA